MRTGVYHYLMSEYTSMDTVLTSSKRLRSSVNGNLRWQFTTEAGVFKTKVDAMCAYKGEPKAGPFTMLLDRGAVVDYGWPAYPMNPWRSFND